MPVYEIQTKEYQCSWCGYKWINRFNGKDGPIPNNCAKCKRANWDKGQVELITPKENGLRRRMKGFNKTYYWGNFTHGTNIIFPNDLSDRFQFRVLLLHLAQYFLLCNICHTNYLWYT